MARATTSVEALLARGGLVRTRIRERSYGDIHDLLPGPGTPPELCAPAHDVVGALEALERQGVVTRAEAVHVYDSTEYSVTWQTAVRHAAPGAG